MKESGFPSILCAERNTLLEGLAWSSFFSPNFPWGWDCREGPHTHRERQTNIQTSVPSHFFCRRDLASLGQPGNSWILRGHTLSVTWIPDLGGKTCNFISVSPQTVRPSNCLKMHSIAVFLLLTALALLHTLGFLKQAGGSQIPAVGPFAVKLHLD